MKILIVDDNDIALELLESTLSSAGHCVKTATNGRQALEILQRDEPRVVITDWEMPEMDGLELCRAIRRLDSTGYVYVILLTSNDSPSQKVEGLSSGADDFVTKPFDRAELVARVRSAERVIAQESHELVIFAMAKLAESRDNDTGLHLERVQRLCRILSQRLAQRPRYSPVIDAEFVRLIYQTSPLHDIGKVGISDLILLKPGRLTPEEFEVMKEHTTLGAATLDAALSRYPNARFLRMARDIAITHHEKWNGCGYPNGLAGEAIPLCGRIVAVADVYDALTSERVYKSAMSHEQAMDIIVKESGAHFDPEIVDAFVDIEAEFNAIRARYGEKPQPKQLLQLA